MSKYEGRIGVYDIEADKPVVLFEEPGPFNEFDTLEEAIAVRDAQAKTDKFAIMKGIYVFNPQTSKFDRQL